MPRTSDESKSSKPRTTKKRESASDAPAKAERASREEKPERATRSVERASEKAADRADKPERRADAEPPRGSGERAAPSSDRSERTFDWDQRSAHREGGRGEARPERRPVRVDADDWGEAPVRRDQRPAGEGGPASGGERQERTDRFERPQGERHHGDRGPADRGSSERAQGDRGFGAGNGGVSSQGGSNQGGSNASSTAQPAAPSHGGSGSAMGSGHQGGQGHGGGHANQGWGMNRMDGFRRKKKRRRGGGFGPGGGYPSGGVGGGGGGGGGGGQRYFDPNLPSDDELEREAAELERAIANSPKAASDTLAVNDLQEMDLAAIHALAEQEGFSEYQATPKQELIFKILKARAARQGLLVGEGTLEIMPDGFGFLRSAEQSYLHGPDDIYVSATLIRRHGLRRGMVVKGFVRPPKDNARNFALLRVDSVNGREPRAINRMVNFEDLTPLHPEKRYLLETSPDEIECRIVDLVAPIGYGQRALIVAPPRTGKTVLMQKMTKAISVNYPKVKIIVLLVDERPEEVTDFRRHVAKGVEVVASTFDENTSRHVQVAEMVIEKAKRMVEFGDDVVILLDSITRLARAYNAETSNSGRIMTGGLDANALQRPKKFFGAARAIDKGGSLTIVATALVDTGSKMDEVIFEEFKGTGNSELHLERKLVEKRIWPAIDVAASGTRREELLMSPKELELTYRLRKVLSDMNVVEAMELLRTKLKKVKTNAEFLMTMNLG